MTGSIKATGDQFVILRQKAQARAGVMRLSRRLVGDAAAFPAFTLVYGYPEQLPGYLAKRLLLSTRLARMAHHHLFLFRTTERLHVAGACAQHGSGIAGAIGRDAQGRVVYSGYDAAHVRLGTYYLGGQPLYQAWQGQLEAVLRASGNSVRAIAELLPVNGTLLNVMLMYEAATDQTDALLNRVFGQLESALHGAMRGMLMAQIPSERIAYGVALQRFSDSLPRFLAVLLKRRSRERLRDILESPIREQMQADTGPRMFARESALLRAMLDQLEAPASVLWQELAHGQALAANDIQDELNDLRLAREELDALGG